MKRCEECAALVCPDCKKPNKLRPGHTRCQRCGRKRHGPWPGLLYCRWYDSECPGCSMIPSEVGKNYWRFCPGCREADVPDGLWVAFCAWAVSHKQLKAAGRAMHLLVTEESIYADEDYERCAAQPPSALADPALIRGVPIRWRGRIVKFVLKAAFPTQAKASAHASLLGFDGSRERHGDNTLSDDVDADCFCGNRGMGLSAATTARMSLWRVQRCSAALEKRVRQAP